MKKIAFCFIALSLLHQSFAQTTALSQKEMLWQKSSHQRTAAWVLLGGGVTLFIIGAAIGTNSFENDLRNGLNNLLNPLGYQPNQEKKANGSGLAIVGTVCAAGSIPFFTHSGKTGDWRFGQPVFINRVSTITSGRSGACTTLN